MISSTYEIVLEIEILTFKKMHLKMLFRETAAPEISLVRGSEEKGG